jgi:hypothetical protein
VRVTSLALPWPIPPARAFHSSLSWSAERGTISEKRQAEWWSVKRDALTIGWADYAEYRVDLHPIPVAEATLGPIPESEAAVAFLMSVLPMALPLFDIEPLHASAVRVEKRALVLLGPRGSGKSSTASALEALGFGLLSDDCCAIDQSERLWPGPPLLNPRWNDAQQPIVGLYNAKAVRAPLQHSSDPLEVAAVVSLEPSEDAPLEIKPLRSSEALVKILGNARAPDLFASRRRSLQLQAASTLSTRPAATLTYDPARHRFGEVAEAVAAWSR